MEKPEVDELVEQITDHINSFSDKSEEFINSMSCQHRTLQQSFTRLCLKWIEHCASEKYRYDLRNEQAHVISKKIVESFMKDPEYSYLSQPKPSGFLPII
jgi:two-component SAPR family response regulator